ncbi:MAG: cadherin-like beta sandwich domain-containing protein, partial [Chthoniobacteraceae bacterium]
IPDIGADEFNSTIATLSTLVLSSGTLSPAFSPNTTSYTAAVSNGTATMTFTPANSDAGETVTVNGGSAGTPVTLTVGSSNMITITVTAQDGTTMKTYMVTVTRRTVFQDWAVANAVSSDPSVIGANGAKNLLNFAFGLSPNSGATGALVFNGSFGAGGTIGAYGLPIVRIEGADTRALFLRRKDYANAGLAYTVQFSGDFSGWQDSADTPAVLADDGTSQIVSVPYPAGFAGGGFFRVRVNMP